MKTIHIIAAVAILLTAGCGIERRPSGDMSYFLLNTERSATRSVVENAPCLRIRPSRIAAAFSGRSLVYRLDEVVYEQDYYNLFLTTPDNQITNILQSWFRQAGFDECVSNDIIRYTLTSQVDALYTDFTNEDTPAAVVQIHITVMKFDEQNDTHSVVLEKNFTRRTPLPENPAAAQAVEGLSRSLSLILHEVEKNLTESL